MANVELWLHIIIAAAMVLSWVTTYIGFNENDRVIAKQRRKIKRLKKIIENKNKVIDALLEEEQQNEEEGYITVKEEDITNAMAERSALLDYQEEHIEALQRLVNSIAKTFNFSDVEPYEREEPEYKDCDEHIDTTAEAEEKQWH